MGFGFRQPSLDHFLTPPPTTNANANANANANSNPHSLTAMTTIKPKIWVPGDWNAFFGFGTNILVNLLTLTALLRFVLKMPDDLVFGKILPATGLMLCLSTIYYAWLAYRLAKKTGRTDVCALPSGISVPHMFVVTFVIMLPISLKTGDPIKGWEAGLTWVFLQSFVLMIGGFCGSIIRRITPRAALLGTLAGVSVTFISMRPALEIFLTPVIGLTCFAIILLSWFGGVKYRGIPAGLVAIAVGTMIAWGSKAFGLNFGGLSLQGLTDSVSSFGFHVPLPVFGHVFSGFEYLGILLVTAIPFGIYDLVEAIDNVESAAVAGDSFPTTRVLTADGVVSLIGCVMGNPFINAVYIGHPGWKAMGGRIGYSAATGIMVILLCWFGTISVMLALIPAVAILPILLYIAMLIGSQAFQETPRSHAPAVVLSLVPHLAAWAITLINGALAAAGTVTPALSPDQMADLVGKMRNEGVLYHGLQLLGGGSILGGLILGAIAAFVIDRKFANAAAFALAGAVLTYFGFMHGEKIGVGESPVIAVSYLIVAVFIFATSKLTVPATVSAPAHEPHEPGPTAEHAPA
jgi:AGZA family xanthine/uracil permease-like MFS transporter